MGKKSGLTKLEFPFSFDNVFDILSKIMTLVLSQRKFYRLHNATFYFGFKILVEAKQSNDVFQIYSILYNQVAECSCFDNFDLLERLRPYFILDKFHLWKHYTTGMKMNTLLKSWLLGMRVINFFKF